MPSPRDWLPEGYDELRRLAAIKPEHAWLVELRHFAGLTGDEAAAALGVSPASADRMWRNAHAWPRVEAGGHGPG